MSARILVLYEDKLSTSSPKNFGPHLLVLACTAERLHRSRESIAHIIDGHPRKGIGDLLKKCQEPALLDRYARILAVCDDDRVREHLSLPANACKTQVRQTVAARSAGLHQLRTVLLARNLETLLDAVHHVLGRGPLTNKPTPLERDRLLSHIVFAGTPDQRRTVLDRVPSLAYLVAALARSIVELKL